MTEKTGLTTHVLDTASGRPAAGVAITVRTPDGRSIAALTNADGRTDAPLVAELADGPYELTFDIGAYFGDASDDDEPGYLSIVPIHVNLTAAMGHAHVALLVTPWSYTTYRGS